MLDSQSIADVKTTGLIGKCLTGKNMPCLVVEHAIVATVAGVAVEPHINAPNLANQQAEKVATHVTLVILWCD